eukprot:TRINITY_DN2436_c0_g1_i1.p1 TRINITY_DN2436_c0_g1~~TRINITY_DN2436_c0_g1_i1.p1  ORF type:complete len:246 (+),score=54.52 TRINITY_DN2436_c0_g1_i1:39-776(+)
MTLSVNCLIEGHDGVFVNIQVDTVVREVAIMAAEESGLSSDWDVYFEGEKLNRDKEILTYGINNDSTLELRFSEAEAARARIGRPITKENLQIDMGTDRVDISDYFIAGLDVNDYLPSPVETPLYYAVRRNLLDKVINILTVKGVDINKGTPTGRSPLYLAANRDYREIAEILISKGADVNCTDKDYITPLHTAAGAGSSNTVALLLSHPNIDLSISTRTGKSAYSAARLKHPGIASMILGKRLA